MEINIYLNFIKVYKYFLYKKYNILTSIGDWSIPESL